MAILNNDELDRVIDNIKEDGVFMIYHDDCCRSISNIRYYQAHYAKICDVPDIDVIKTAAMRVGEDYIVKFIAEWFENARREGKQTWTYTELAQYVAMKLLNS